MPSYDAHLGKAESNFQFLSSVNRLITGYPDWEVTICFYTALHLMNAHLAKHDLHYRSHNDVDYALNPYGLSPSKITEDVYIAYRSLRSLSRRARYLVSEKGSNDSSVKASFTYDVHVAKACRHLDTILNYFHEKGTLGFSSISFHCNQLKPGELNFIKVLS